MPDRPVVVRPMPSSDLAFRRVVERLAAEVPSAADLEARLRSLYPKASVAPRGLAGEPAIYYVYRDGRYEPEPTDAWWLEPDAARVRISTTTGRLTAVNDPWSRLMAGEASSLVGRHYTDFVLPEAMTSVMVVFETLVATGRAHSEVLLRRPDGTKVAFEYHGEAHGDEVEVAYRPLRG